MPLNTHQACAGPGEPDPTVFGAHGALTLFALQLFRGLVRQQNSLKAHE